MNATLQHVMFSQSLLDHIVGAEDSEIFGVPEGFRPFATLAGDTSFFLSGDRAR